MKVSIICACKNRAEPLYASIKSWLLKKEICEVIIVDWSSDESISDIINLDSRIKVIRVNGEKYFNMPEPLNLAASVATGDALLTMATDYFFNPYDEYNFFKRYPIDDTSFVCGMSDYNSDPRTYEPIFYYLRGLLYVSRKNFLEVGGYREGESKYYGNEDDELIDRLKKSGLEKKLIDQSYTIFHIPHTDKKRIENFEGYHTDKNMNHAVHSELSKKYSGQQLEWQCEYVIAQRHIRKNLEKYTKTSNFKNTKWDINKISDQYYDAKKLR
tara:strand:+ start:340 stop:1152 length:813 start_codon:yes stop_codon:yes gene_type:complete